MEMECRHSKIIDLTRKAIPMEVKDQKDIIAVRRRIRKEKFNQLQKSIKDYKETDLAKLVEKE